MALSHPNEIGWLALVVGWFVRRRVGGWLVGLAMHKTNRLVGWAMSVAWLDGWLVVLITLETNWLVGWLVGCRWLVGGWVGGSSGCLRLVGWLVGCLLIHICDKQIGESVGDYLEGDRTNRF